MQQEPGHIPTRGIAVPTANGYEVPEGKGEFMNRNSILLLIGQSISLIGDGFYLLTVQVWLLTYLVASAATPAAKSAAALTLAAATTIIFGSQYLSQFLVLPFAGVFVDRWNRKTAMLVANLVQTVIALLPLVAYYGPRNLFLPTLYVTFFLLVVAQGFFQSAELGTVQVIVSQRRAPQLISFFQTLIALGTVVGALFSGTFFLSTGPLLAIGINALSFLISAVFIFFMRVPREAIHPHAYRKTSAEGQTSVSSGLGSVLKDLAIGTRFSFTTPFILGLIIMLVVSQIGAGAVNGLYGGFFVLNLHGDPAKDASLLNILPAALGAGALIGALLAGLLTRFMPIRSMTVVSVILLGLGLALFAFQGVLVVGVALFTLIGVFQGIFQVGYNALIVKASPQTLVGRVSAAISSITALSSLGAAFGIARIVDYFNPLQNPLSPFAKNPSSILTIIFAIAGVLIALGGVVGFLIFIQAKESTTTTAGATAGEMTGD
ncbi:MAG TPA: MFS transporter [Ktedonobacteraceae bacterium]|nr:MFS transporter [Ktedonobacteraceae bacterium]